MAKSMLQFTKMHGLGNDFILIDAINQKVNLKPNQIKFLAHRHLGIGFDQCLLIEKSNHPNIDFFYRIYNADGGEVGQCGNGARCVGLFAKHYGLTNKNKIKIATRETVLDVEIHLDDSVTVNMGVPKFAPKDIPLSIETKEVPYKLKLPSGEATSFYPVNIGNPHAVILVDDVQHAPVELVGSFISHHPLFPEQTNVGFMQIIDKNHITLRVYERGAKETKACGSGAVAAVIIGSLYFQLDKEVIVTLPGGDLQVTWANQNDSVFLKGPATFVFEGSLISF